MANRPNPLLLLILDGFGARKMRDNAIALAVTAYRDSLQQDYPMPALDCFDDIGNIEQMLDPETKQAHTAHTMNLAPLIHVSGGSPLSAGGNLVDLAPTMLAILGVARPAETTKRSLINQ